MSEIKKIILPTRPQVDTIVAIFLLKTCGKEKFPGIESATLEIMPNLPEGKSADQVEGEGTLLIDIGGGKFDHHNKKPKTTVSNLVAEHLGIKEDPAIAKLLEFARRDDFFGKGIVSDDPIDRALGFPGLLASANRARPNDPGGVLELFLGVLDGHYQEEVRRTKEMPKEFEQKLESGAAETFEVKQRDKKLKVVIIDSDNVSIPGFLRSRLGGGFDVVAQVRSSGHINILTRPAKRIDLRSLAAMIRIQELTLAGDANEFDANTLSISGRVDNVPMWYYDTATNSIQNGGANPEGVTPTRITRFDLKKILEIGLSERLWSPVKMQ